MTHTISLATQSDVPSLVDCALQSAHEAGRQWADRFNRAHAERHMTRLAVNGVCFVATKGKTVVGMIACARIDVGFADIPDLETAHIYVRPEERTSPIIFELFKAVEDYARKHKIKVLFHQANYPAAIDGRGSNGARVETLFKRRRYTGPIDIVYAAPDFVRVGLTYLYDGAEVAALAGAEKPGPRYADVRAQ